MQESNYEAQHKEEYYQKISDNLDALLEVIKTVKLDASDFEVLSGKATFEVDEYMRKNLILPLSDAQTRLSGKETEATTVSKLTTEQAKKVVKGTMQRILLFSRPLQEIFSALKEVPYLNPGHYEALLQKHNDVVKILNDFIDQLESGRNRRLGKA
jgi:phage terminase Nu1 subunit (DNA packaging protein)